MRLARAYVIKYFTCNEHFVQAADETSNDTHIKQTVS